MHIISATKKNKECLLNLYALSWLKVGEMVGNLVGLTVTQIGISATNAMLLPLNYYLVESYTHLVYGAIAGSGDSRS